MARTHVVLPDDLLVAIDHIVGKHKRSRFIEEAVREKLRRVALATALEVTAGSIEAAHYPAWSTPQKASQWVQELRRENELSLTHKLGLP